MILLLACVETAEGPWVPALGATRQVVPGEGVPPEVVEQDAHNNLDVIDFRGKTWLAWRTAPTHFASEEARLYVVSSEDETTWAYETELWFGTDLREPRFLVLDDRLFLYFAMLGKDPLAFEPQGTYVTERLDDGSWTPPVQIYEPTFILWRARTIDGVPYLVGYDGGENIYEVDGEPLRVHWLTTTDGVTLEPVVPGQPVVEEGGGSETDFAFAPDGALVAVTRNEAGDETGWGSKICRAEPADLGRWTCVADPKKYDSPLVFTHDGAVWLIARRNLTDTGEYDLFLRDLSMAEQTYVYQVDYWQHPKRCSLWSVDPATLAVTWALDLPSRGDTCFASTLARGEHAFAVYNYSSPLEGDDLSWVEAQQGPTSLYRSELLFAR